jgi:hypothetical protein
MNGNRIEKAIALPRHHGQIDQSPITVTLTRALLNCTIANLALAQDHSLKLAASAVAPLAQEHWDKHADACLRDILAIKAAMANADAAAQPKRKTRKAGG